MELDPKAVRIANEKLWSQHPDLHRRQLTMGPLDEEYRHQWMQFYSEAAEQSPKPPPPKVTPEPVEMTLPASVASQCGKPCERIANMTDENKRVEAIQQADLGKEVLEEIGDLKTIATGLSISIGLLIAAAATGVGAIADVIAGLGLVLILLGAGMSLKQIIEGLISLMDFFEKTRCDRAKTHEDLADAGKSFSDGIAKIGVGGLFLLLTLAGARKGPRAGKMAKIGQTEEAIDDAVRLAMKNKNNINHLFQPKHKLGSLVNELGGQENTIRTILNAAKGKLPSSGVFEEIPVNVGGSVVFISGKVINGVPRLGTMYIP